LAVSEESVKAAYLRVLEAHRRAIARHEAAAELQERAARPDAAEMQRRGAAPERERLAAAELRHPEWLEGPRRR
jgi:hypothetical protein